MYNSCWWLLLVDRWQQAAAAAAIPYYAAAAAWKLRKYVGFRAYFLKPSGAPGKCHTRKYPTPVRIWKAPYTRGDWKTN